jgi:hypothetical protein
MASFVCEFILLAYFYELFTKNEDGDGKKNFNAHENRLSNLPAYFYLCDIMAHIL